MVTARASSIVALLVFIALLALINTSNGKWGFVSGCHEAEREALYKFKETAIDSTNRLSSWKGDDCCEWYGVTCHNVTRHVLRLDLRLEDPPCFQRTSPYHYFPYNFDLCSIQELIDSQLKFSNLDPSLLELKHLRYLDLSRNTFYWSHIPEFIGSMNNLRYLNLSSAMFSGFVPPQLGNLTRLQALDLHQLIESYPFNLQTTNLNWISSLVKLKYLDLKGINIATQALNPLQPLIPLTSLVHLGLSGVNKHVGKSLSTMTFYNSTLGSSIEYLDLSNNYFTGPLPNNLANMTFLKFLDLSNNQLNGAIPYWLVNTLDVLNLEVNFFSHVEGESNVGVLENPRLSPIKYLDLSYNNLEGSLPHCLENMTSLTFLDLSRNQMSGSIPLWIRNLQKLKSLSLDHNSFTDVEGGTIMGFLGKLCHLKVLDLGENNLVGEDKVRPSDKKFSHCVTYELEALDLSGNSITAAWVNWLGELKSLKHLSLDRGIKFNGPIPTFIGNLSSLERLSVRDCGLTGHIPSFLGELSSLRDLDLTNNSLHGSIPRSLGASLSLTGLYLGDNALHGTIPWSLGKVSSLNTLDLSGNALHGTIPWSLGALSSMTRLDLSNNALHGTIPLSLGALSSLMDLDLSSNFLEGVVSDQHVADLSRLKFLDLSFNPLSIKLSSKMPPTFQLNTLQMRSCRSFEGEFPHWIKMQNELSRLDLSNNGIFGEFPAWFPNPKLEDMNLSHNHITGPIPHFQSSSQLWSIDISYNSLSGSLFRDPSTKNDTIELCQLISLTLLHLQRNQLFGDIPNCWDNSKNLIVIDLSSNKLSGLVPVTFWQLPKLEYLKLSNNSLHGTIPATLNDQRQSWLAILDLGDNTLTGEVPNWGAKSHPYLKDLILRGNQLQGGIPSRLCTLPHLQFLDLAINNLTGSIPRCFGHFQSMKFHHTSSSIAKALPTYPVPQPPAAPVPLQSFKGENAMVIWKGVELQYTTTLELVVNLDLSCNGLVGSIPQEITKLSGLIGLNLSNNQLTGSIPQMIGEMKSLESLDLSNNILSGTIPSSISAITSLEHLNLSCNKLHGEIPTGSQLRTFNDPSIYGNNAGLCGDPLPNKCVHKHDKDHQQEGEEGEKDKEDNLDRAMFYVAVVLGFATGFWGVVGSLVLKKTWRHAVFRRVENITNLFYVKVVLRINRLIKN